MSKMMAFETATRTIGECFPYIKNGANIKQDKEGDGIPITRIETISGGTFHRNRMGYANIHDAEKYQNWILHDGDILMSHINSIPNMGRTVEYKAEEGETIIHGMNLLALRADRTIVIPGYADIYFNSTIFRNYVFHITKKAVNQASFSIKDLKTLPIPLPSLETQRIIAQQFTQINTLHRALLQKIDCLDTATKSRFVEMFGDPIRRPKWPTKSLRRLCTKLGSGATPRGGKAAYKEQGIPLVRSMNVHNGRFVRDDLAYIDSDQAEKLRNVTLEKADVLLNITGASVARSCVLPDELEGGRVNQHVAIIRANKNELLPCVLNTALINDSYQQYLLDGARMSGATREAITKQDLENMHVPVPPIALQQEFAAFVSQVDKLRFATQQQIDKLEMLKKSLLQEYFN